MEKSLSAESRPTATFGSIVLNIPHISLLLPNNVRCTDTTQLLADLNRRADRAADVISAPPIRSRRRKNRARDAFPPFPER